MTDIHYNIADKYSKTSKILFLKERKLIKELNRNKFQADNLKTLIYNIYQLYKNPQKKQKLRIDLKTKKELEDFLIFFQFSKWKQTNNKKGMNTIMSQSISRSKIIPSLYLVIDSFVDYKNNNSYSKKHIIISK